MSTDLKSAFLGKLETPGFLRKARPPHVFVLERERLSYAGARGRSKKGDPVVFSSRPLPPGTFRSGAGGAPVAGEGLAKAIAALKESNGLRSHSATLIVPDDFVKAIALDVPELPAKASETEEMVRWKVGKAFGEGTHDLRISWQVAAPGPAGNRILAIAVSEEAVASWENPFHAAGIRIGALESATLAISTLARGLVGPDGFVVWAGGDTATTLFFKEGVIRFLRTRPFADDIEALQEIRLSASFVDGPGGPDVPLDLAAVCAAGPAASPVVRALRAFRAEAGAADPVELSRAKVLSGMKVEGDADDPAFLLAAGALSAME